MVAKYLKKIEWTARKKIDVEPVPGSPSSRATYANKNL